MENSEKLYLNLLKKALTQQLWPTVLTPIKKKENSSLNNIIRNIIIEFFLRRQLIISKWITVEPVVVEQGKWWPIYGETMIGRKRLDNIQHCIETIINDDIPGDLIEAGVWRGGATIFMRAALTVFNKTDKIVWVADSFEGLPEPNPTKYPADKGDIHYKWNELNISLEEVKNNFKKYDLLSENVKFLKGWFKDSLPNAPINDLCLVRLDGDIYESTMDSLVNLYPKLVKGGYIIVDDYQINDSCAKAVDEYRLKNEIFEKINKIDWTGVFWRREK